MKPRERLSLLPSPLYYAKAAAVRGRSIAWRLNTAERAQVMGIRILFYHRVSDDSDPLAVTPRRFRDQMDFLAANGYEVVGVAEAVRVLQASRTPHRVVGLTFDDGYLDVAKNALPVLSERGFRATVFVVTGALDGRANFAWYDRCPPLLSWREISELDSVSPFRFEAHTVTHSNLLTLDERAAKREIVDSKRALEEQLGRRVEAFSYPAGLYGRRELRLVNQAGYQLGVSCEPGINSRFTDVMALRRTAVDARDGLLDFQAKVAGGHDSPLPLRAHVRRLRYGAG
jgi:peptidoglycan/xylan/chitin deacetylase (PgdA/CDA1 family)